MFLLLTRTLLSTRSQPDPAGFRSTALKSIKYEAQLWKVLTFAFCTRTTMEPVEVQSVEVVPVMGQPDPDRICTVGKFKLNYYPNTMSRTYRIALGITLSILATLGVFVLLLILGSVLGPVIAPWLPTGPGSRKLVIGFISPILASPIIFLAVWVGMKILRIFYGAQDSI